MAYHPALLFSSLFAFISLVGLLPLVSAWDGPPLQPTIPGIAFGLTPDIGTIAIHFPNGTVVQIDRTEWKQSQSYRTFMRKPDGLAADVERCNWLPSNSTDYDRNADFEVVKALLTEFKAVVEAVLGTQICFAELVIPDLRQSYQRRVIEEALVAVGLRQMLSTSDAPKAALYANDIEHPVVDDEQVVLVVGYSKSHLNLALFLDDEGLVESIRQDYQQGLGADDEPRQEHWPDVVVALNQISSPPLGNSETGSSLPRNIEKLVLYGDALEAKFLDVLRLAVGAELVDRAHVYSSAGASTVGMAQMAFRLQDGNEFREAAAIGCTGQSRL
ncbi:hypothetical protein BGZ61DRAFT_473304 [Ilyonectria robusta]|uniref:uncharacterized protein n=1 Tax=Ilyonectria robusta TaxID=1079257 RepID=UPI001E8EC917|nr:uncharacterized protein BGZ61DRAFT_473304 [Ilyonectria robusta]KAH8734580.1 hypothetical protein BGZ61DRAFT_473304 [Ilyonectria robusta]